MADLTLAVVEAAFSAHLIVSSLTIYPSSIMLKKLSMTLMEYSGLVESTLK